MSFDQGKRQGGLNRADGSASSGGSIGKRTLTMELDEAATSVQLRSNAHAPERPAAMDADPRHAMAQEGTRGTGTALPHFDMIQQLFGHHDISNVKAHVGGAAADASRQMGAAAYATGNHVAFRSSPDLHTAAHEAAHVVQQRGGVQLKGGIGAVGDNYERHADAVADKVVRGESAEALLDQMHGSGGGSAVQLLATAGGEFDATNYTPYSNGVLRGTNIEITFTPNDLVVAPKLGLTQTIKSTKGGAPYYLGTGTEGPERRARATTATQGDEGRQIDRVAERTNPMYGIDNPPSGGGLGGATTSSGSNGRFGRRIVDPSTGAADRQPAWLSDRPALRWASGTAMEQIFETTALAIEGPMAGTYLGSVEWGVQTAGDTGVPTPMPFRVISQGVPTHEFLAAATNWNAQTISMPGRIAAPVAGTVASREALVAGTQYASNALVLTITTTTGPVEVRMPVAAAFDSFLVAVGARVTAGQQLAVYRTQDATVDLPVPGHQTVDPATLSDVDLETRMRALFDEILHLGDHASPDYQNKRFEIRALGRVAVARGRDAVDSGHTYTVRNGDTLGSIAETQLGDRARWTRIMALNAIDLQDPTVISNGATLKMPRPFTRLITPPAPTPGSGTKRPGTDGGH